MMDVLPTFAHLASGKIPTDRVLDGGNIWPLLSATSGAKSPHADEFYYYRGLTLEAVRSGPWKLQLSGGGATKKKNDAAKLAPQKPAEAFPKLYHLGSDIGESTNLAAEHPDEVARLRTLAEKMNADRSRSPHEARAMVTKLVSGAASRKPPLAGWISRRMRETRGQASLRIQRQGKGGGAWRERAYPMAMSAGRA